MVHALNPRDVNLGAIWEERRRAWLENAGANRYFWYSFGATAMLILSWFALAWVHTDRVRERWQLAEHAADALRYAEYCKRRAKEAISRYNVHVETCNRVIEAGESGIATPETANLEDYKRESNGSRATTTRRNCRSRSLERTTRSRKGTRTEQPHGTRHGSGAAAQEPDRRRAGERQTPRWWSESSGWRRRIGG